MLRALAPADSVSHLRSYSTVETGIRTERDGCTTAPDGGPERAQASRRRTHSYTARWYSPGESERQGEGPCLEAEDIVLCAQADGAWSAGAANVVARRDGWSSLPSPWRPRSGAAPGAAGSRCRLRRSRRAAPSRAASLIQRSRGTGHGSPGLRSALRSARRRRGRGRGAFASAAVLLCEPVRRGAAQVAPGDPAGSPSSCRSAGLSFVMYLSVRRSRRYQPRFHDKYFREVPDPALPPACVGYLMHDGRIRETDAVATLLRPRGRGVAIAPVNEPGRRRQDESRGPTGSLC